MATLLIASTAPGAGKSAFAAWLADRLVSLGSRTALVKSFSTSEGATDPDARAFTALVPAAVSVDPVPLAGDAPSDDAIQALAEGLSGLPEDVEAVIVEGLSGAPEANLRIAERLDARIVVIGRLDDDYPSATRSYGERLLGVVVNNVTRYREHRLRAEVAPALAAAGIRCLGWIPEDRRLVAVTLRAISEHLDGKFEEWEGHSDELVDYLLIGGNVLDWGVHYFRSRENAAVLVRGDRPDIQMAALATPVKGLVLTGGTRPIEYVYYEADQNEVPVAVAPHSTHEAAAILESLQDRARFDHPDKLARLRELAEERIDFAALQEAIQQPVTT